MTADAHENDDDALSSSIIRVVESYGELLTIYLWHPYTLVGSDSVSRWMNPGHEVGIHFNDMSDTGAGISRGSRLHRLRAILTRFGLRRLMPDLVWGSRASWASMRTVVANAIADFRAAYPTAPLPKTSRTHDLLWASNDAEGRPDPTAQAQILRDFGIEMDVTFTAFPKRWGYMTGRGLPLKFLDPTVAEGWV